MDLMVFKYGDPVDEGAKIRVVQIFRESAVKERLHPGGAKDSGVSVLKLLFQGFFLTDTEILLFPEFFSVREVFPAVQETGLIVLVGALPARPEPTKGTLQLPQGIFL